MGIITKVERIDPKRKISAAFDRRNHPIAVKSPLNGNVSWVYLEIFRGEIIIPL
jgi:hypothetical protein